MNLEKFQINPTIEIEKQINGLVYGFFGGFWFALGAWGLDALLLSQANADNAGLKLLIGAPFVIIIGGVAGWLTAHFDRPALGVVIWLLTGLCYGWIGSHVPFDWLTQALSYLDPDFHGLDLYPFVFSAQMRTILVMVLMGFILAFAGGFELFFIDSATHAASKFRRFLNLMACFVIFLPLGLIVDNLVTSPLRASTIGLHQTIQLAREAKKTGISLDAKRASGIRVLDIFGEHIDNSYKISLGTYNKENLQETTVFVNFSGYWGTCSAVESKAIVCWRGSERYLNKLNCVINGGSLNFCGIKKTLEAGAPDLDALLELDHQTLTYGIIGARGPMVLVLARDAQGHQVECRMRDEGDVYLDDCYPSQSRKFEAHPLPPTATRPAPTAASVVVSDEIELKGQEAVMLDPSQLQLPALQGSPIYTITLDLADDLLSFEGTSQIEVTNNETVTLDALYFHLLPNGKGSYGDGSLTVNQVMVDGKEVRGELSDDTTVLKVPLVSALMPGEKTWVGLIFHGGIPRDFGGTATPAGYGIFNLTDGVLALSGWYPILSVYDEFGWRLEPPSSLGDSVYSDISFYTVDISAPKRLTIAATGIALKENFTDEDKQMRFVSGPVREFFIVASDTFQVASQKTDGTTINSYYKIDDLEAGRKALSVASASLQVFKSRFGDYPYKELDIIAAPMRNALGVEFPGIVMIGADLYSKPDDPSFEITVAHEVSHQWWYNVVGNDVFQEPWLDEALATYSSGLYYELINGPEYFRGLKDYWNQGYQKLVDQGKDDMITETLGHFESLEDQSIYGGIVYRKGALFFVALRKEIGDRAFFQAINSYYNEKRYLIARSSDLLSAFETASKRNLRPFFQEWLY